MLGHLAAEAFREVLDDPGTLAVTALEGPTALRADRTTMLALTIDFEGLVSVMSRMAGLGPPLGSTSLGGVGFGIDGNLPQGGGGIGRYGRCIHLGLERGDLSRRGHHGQDHRLRTEPVELSNEFLGAGAVQDCLDDLLHSGVAAVLRVTHAILDNIIQIVAPA